MRRLAPPLPQNSAGTPQVVPKLLIPQRFVKESALSYPNRCATVSGRCSFYLVWESPAEEQRPDPSVYASVERHNVAKIPGPVNTFLLRRVARLGPASQLGSGNRRVSGEIHAILASAPTRTYPSLCPARLASWAEPMMRALL